MTEYFYVFALIPRQVADVLLCHFCTRYFSLFEKNKPGSLTCLERLSLPHTGIAFADDMAKVMTDLDKRFDRAFHMENKYGLNGFDSAEEATHPVLLAYGPAFRKVVREPPPSNETVRAAAAVDVHPLLCHVLGLRDLAAPARDGKIDGLVHLLEHPPKGHELKETISHIIDLVASPEHLPLTREGEREIKKYYKRRQMVVKLGQNTSCNSFYFLSCLQHVGE